MILKNTKLIFLMLGHFINDSYMAFLSPLLPLLILKFNISLTLASLLVSISTLSSSFAQLLFGYLADKLTKYNLFIYGPLITGIFMSLIGVMPKYSLLLLILIIAGLGTAMFHPQATAAAGYLNKSKKGLIISIFIASGGIGYSIGPLIVAYIVSNFGLEKTYLAIFPAIIAFLLLLKFKSPLNNTQNKINNLKEVISNNFKPLFFLWLITVIRQLVRLSFTTFLPFLLLERNFSLVGIGLALFIYLIFGSIGGVFGGYLSDRISRKNIILISLLLAFPFAYMFLNTTGLLSFIFLSLTGMALFASDAVNIAMAQEIIPNHASTASALTMGFAWGVSSLMLIIVGVLADTIGVFTTLNYVIFLTIAGALLALPLPKTQTL